MADCLLLLLQGSVLTGITCTWTNLIGPWFYALMLAVLEIVIAVKYDNILAPSLIGMFVGILMINFMPTEMIMLPVGIVALNIAAIVYNRFVGN